ncbi:class II aldolase [Bordetella trematum]|uniref:class II aldolase/adducin family protein n=1 Tax=Bordetella trematum TaxID=123899 RepID=UPI000691CC14|nr:class II aldolase/adducin family protein [Bordetella trematum]AUL48162.1 class II aldolase [Bordetella trematum]
MQGQETSYSSFDLPVRQVQDTTPGSAAEMQVRRDLAAAYRLCALFGWDDLIYTHLSARVPGKEHHFLVNPLGLAFDEITASSLVKIDLQGNVIGPSIAAPNAAGFVIHGAIHAAREDAQCVMHLHTESGMALSCLEEGLLPLTQHAMRFHGRLGYHDYEGIALTMGEQERLVADLGAGAAMILRNHGTLTVGRSVGHAFVEMFYLEKAARVQLQAQASGRPLRLPDEALASLTAAQWMADLVKPQSREWPALLRRLDQASPGYAD